MTSRRLVLLALDAADSHLVRRWAREGALPTLGRLLDAAVTAPIATPPAVLESAIWPTTITGSSPARHGMFAGGKIRIGTYEMHEGMRPDRLAVRPFWAHLSRAGKRVAVIDVPFARPHKLRGIQVTNWGCHDAWAWERSSWPPRLITDLVRRFGDHPVGHCDAPSRSIDEYEDLRRRLIAGVRRKAALLRYCLELAEWDLFFGVFSESHCAGHHFWHFMDPSHPRYDPNAPTALQDAIRDVYRAIDAGVAEVLRGLPSEAHVLLLLSHGMGPWHDGSHLLDLVLERLEGKAGDESTDGSEPEPYLARRRLWSSRRILPTVVRRALKNRLPDSITRLWTWAHPPSHPWQYRRAFAIPGHNMTGGVRINLKGREPLGRVAPGREYDKLCKELTDSLLALENPETGTRAVQWVARADSLYQGPHLREMPDLFVEWDHGASIRMLSSPHIGTVSGNPHAHRSGEHRGYGLLAGVGPGFRQGAHGGSLRSQDVASTILEFFGVRRP